MVSLIRLLGTCIAWYHHNDHIKLKSTTKYVMGKLSYFPINTTLWGGRSIFL
jgi:hypothetical protein